MFKQIKERFSKAKKPAKKQPKTLQYEELEQRVLFSADFVPGLDNIAVDEQVLVQDITGDVQAEREATPETVEQTAAEQRRELVIVNDDVADYEQLVADLQGSDDNRIIEVVVLDTDRDGIEQVSEILAERSDVAAVHFITHGCEGQINLGNSRLTSTTLEENSDAVAGWGNALTESGDILFYGCKIAADGDGQSLLKNIAELTGAEVAASDDLTGSSEQGGDWDLEYQAGSIDARVAVSETVQATWNATLANEAPVLSGANDLAAIDEDPISNTGTLVSDLISGQITDPDAGALSGIAIIGVDNTNGTWEYTTNGGGVWTAFGTPSTSAARLLAADADTSVRFVPDADWNGTVTDGITFHAWDQTSGTAGGTADLTSAFTVVDNFDAVSYSGGTGWTGAWQEIGEANGPSLGAVNVTSAGDVVAGPYLSIDLSTLGTGISREVDLSSATTTTLSFTYEQNNTSLTGELALEIYDGTSWTTLHTYNIDSDNYIGAVGIYQSFDITNYTDANTQIRFRTTDAALGDEFYVDNVQIDYTTGGGTGGTTAFSTATASSSITVNPVDDAPTALQATTTSNGGLSLNEDGGNDAYLIADDGIGSGGLSQITYELRFNASDLTSRLAFVSYYNSGDELSVVTEPTGELRIAVDNKLVTSSAMNYESLRDGQTHTFTLTWDNAAGDWQVFIDGIIVDSGTGLAVGQTIDSGGTLIIGQEQDAEGGGFATPQRLSATLYDARFFDVVRTQEEILANYSSTLPYDEPNQIANWTFNVLSSDGVVIDTVTGNNLTVQHVSDPAFTASTPELTLAVDENATTGAVVGTISGSDADREALIASLMAADPDLVYSATTGKFYKAVNTLTYWSTAQTSAEGTVLAGVNGQLVIIRSAAENEIVWNLAKPIGDSVYIGASDQTTEGSWYWQSGGSDADQFWSGANTGTNIDGSYTNWNATQPNDLGGAEDVARLDSGDGLWYDTTITGPNQHYYAVEWDADTVLDSTRALTYSIVSQTVPGAFTIVADSGKITVADGSLLDYETATSHSVEIQVTDSGGLSYNEIFTISIADVNDAPTAANNSVTTNEDTTYNFTAADFNFSDVDGDILASVKITSLESAGSLKLSGADVTLNQVISKADIDAGNLTFVPVANVNGTGYDSFGFSVNDGTVDSSTSYTMSIDVTVVNDDPMIGGNDTGSVTEDVDPDVDTLLETTGASTISDPDAGESNFVAQTISGTYGDLTIDAAGNWSYAAGNMQAAIQQLHAGESVSDVLSVTTADGTTHNVTITIHGAEDAPVAVNDNHGLDFDGIDDYVSIADSASLTMTNTVTMEAWIKADPTVNVNRMIINKEGEYEVALFPDGTINWAFANTDPDWTWHNTGYVVPDGEWTHIAVAYDNGTVSTYANGTLVDVYNGSGPIGDAHATLDELRIGGRSNDPAGKYFDGRIDDVRVWSTARTQVQIQTMMDQTLTGGETGLTGYWKFDEGSGTTVADSTGNGNNGTLIDGGAGTAGPQWTGYSTDQNTQINITAANGIVGNDIDSDGDVLTVTQVNGSGANVGSLFTLPSGANLTLGPLGAFIYNPNGTFDSLDVGETAVDTFTYLIDDGNGGTDTAIVSITITGAEDAPTAAGNTVSTNEDTTYIFNASDFNFSDIDSDTLASVKITNLETVGSLQLSSGDVTLNQIISKADIDAGNLKFVPVADANGTGYDSFQFTVNDGTIDSATSYTMTIDVTAVNDAPTVSLSNLTATLSEDTDTTTAIKVADIIISDDGLGTNNLTLVGADAAMFSIVGTELFLNAGATLDFETNASLDVSVEVDDPGLPATPEDSVAMAISITDANEAPLLSGANDLTAIDEDPISNPGTLVSDLIAGQISDPDSGALTGIAVIGVDDTNGTWEYTIDGGSNWIVFGAVDASSARLLTADANTYVRFVPDANWNGTVTNGITIHAWDQTSGTAGDTADLTATATVLDQFNAASFSGNDGTANWVDEWQELGEFNGPIFGAVEADGTPAALEIGGFWTNITGDGVQRQVDLSSAVSATLTLDVWRLGMDTTGTVTLAVSSDGTNWTDLETFRFDTAPISATTYSYDISANASTTTWVRLLGSGTVGGFLNVDYLYFDNVRIEYTTGGGTGGTTAFSAASASSSITVNPVLDAPAISGDSTGAVTEDMDPDLDNLLETSGALTIADPDVGESSFQAEIVVGIYGSLTIDTAGSWCYAADNTQAAIQQLDAGESVSDVLTVTTADGTTHSVTITINGAEDAPVIGGTSTGTVAEDGTLTANGALSITDVDTSDNPISFPDEGNTLGDNGYGDFALTGSTWTYTLNNTHAAVQVLDVGESLTDIHTFTASDGSTQVVTITINGAEDAPVIGGTSTGTVAEDGTLTANGALTISDVDTSDNPISFPDVASTLGDNGYGDFVLTGGTWTYTLNNAHAAVQALDAGENLTDTHTFTASDGSTQAVTITINGAEDAPVIGGTATGFVTEDGKLTANGALTISDVDTSDNPISFTDEGSTLGNNGYGDFALTGGTWTYTLNNAHAAVQVLDVGESLTDIHTFTASDGSTQVVTITINGAEDAPVIGGTSTGTVAEDGTLTANGALTINDVDTSDNPISFPDVASTLGDNGYGDFVLNAGTWTYTLNNAHAAVQALDVGENLTDTHTFTASDGSTQAVTITINGAEDAPVIGGTATGFVTEDGKLTANGALTISDVDTSDNPISFTDEGSTLGNNGYGDFALTGGTWTYTLNNAHAAVQALDVGESLTDIHTFTASDGSTQVVTITINGAEDAPVIGGTSTGTVAEDGTLTANGALTINDVDTSDNPISFPDVASTLGDNGYGDFVLNAGTWTYTLNNAHAAVQALDVGENLTDTHTFTASDGSTQAVTITINGAEDAPIIGGTSIGTVGEDGTLNANGTLTISDVDASDNPISFPDEAIILGDNGYGDFVLTDGTWTYTLNNAHAAVQALDVGESLTDTHIFTASDGSTQLVTMTINGAEDAPVLGGVTAGAVTEDGALTAGDEITITDVDTADNPVNWVDEAVTAGDNGYGTFEIAGGTWTYTLNNAHAAVQALGVGESLTDTYTFTATDGSTQLVAMTINGAEDTPIAVDDTVSGNEDTVITGNVLTNDTDAEADALTAGLVSGPAHGSLTLNADGSFSYTPDADWNGTDSFTYTANDGALDSNVASMTITVNPVNDAPRVPSSPVTTATEGVAYSYTITTRDVDGDALTITAPTLPAWLTLVDNGDGTATLSGTPTNAELGDHRVALAVSDGVLTDIQNFTLTVSGTTIDPPVDDTDPDLRGSTTTDPELFEDPETDDEPEPAVEVPTHEDQPQDMVIEAEPSAPPVVEDLAPQGSADADDQLVHMQDPQINEEIIYLTDDYDDTDSQSEEREDDPSIVYFDNDFYKDLSLSKYLNINYTAAGGPMASSGDEISILNFDSDDPIQDDVNGDYDLHRQQLDESFDTELKSQETKAKIVSITAASFAAGFVSYLLRAGSLVANLMSTLPLWRGFDPIVIFSGDKKKKKKDRNEIANPNEAKAETLFDDKVE